MQESPIFTRTHDLICWLIPLTVKFPRSQRFVVAGRLQQRALDFQSGSTSIETPAAPIATTTIFLFSGGV
jgi:hypothetical protein